MKGMLRKKMRMLGHAPDGVFLFVSFTLIVAGLFALSSASSDIGALRFGSSFHFLESQILKGLLPGLILGALFYSIYYRRFKKVSFILFFLNIVLMVLVFTPFGYEAKGSYRWIDLGVFSFQPSELLKITFVIYLASLFSSTHTKSLKRSWKMTAVFAFLSIVVGSLILFQPATTMAVVILLSGGVMFLFHGARLKHIGVIFVVGVVVASAVVAFSDYRFDRFVPFWNSIVAEHIAPSLKVENVEVDSFHVDQSRISIGAGGVSGVGFGQSTSKYSILPEPIGDSIFSVIAEEFGFVGSSFIILCFSLLFWRGTDIVRRSRDEFAQLVVLGFISIITIQTLIHIGANSGVLPFTGVPLPFISYGGTALVVFLTMVGLIANISRHTGKVSSL